MPERGLLIAFEGGDGSGKSTQSLLLAQRIGAVHTRQAGGTPVGLQLRSLILDPSSADISARTEALLFMADRAEQADKVVRPALGAGSHVVSDRWAYSSMAYQGARHGLDVEELRQLADWSTRSLWPDIVVLIDVSVETGMSRAGVTDHYEAAGAEVQHQVRRTYRNLAEADPGRWHVVDGEAGVQEVAERVYAVVAPLLEK